MGLALAGCGDKDDSGDTMTASGDPSVGEPEYGVATTEPGGGLESDYGVGETSFGPDGTTGSAETTAGETGGDTEAATDTDAGTDTDANTDTGGERTTGVPEPDYGVPNTG